MGLHVNQNFQGHTFSQTGQHVPQQPDSALRQVPLPAGPSLWLCLSFTTKSSSFLLYSVIPLVLTVELQVTFSLCSQVVLSRALPSFVFSKAFNILEQSDGNNLHHQLQCWAVLSWCRSIEHPCSTTKVRPCRCGQEQGRLAAAFHCSLLS